MADDIAKVPDKPDDVEGALEIRIPRELDPTANIGAVWTSLKPGNDLERARLMAALQGSIPKLADVIGQSFPVSNVALQMVQVTRKDTGEVFQTVRTVLFGPDGKAYAAVSDGVRASVGMICQLFGYPPWKPPMPMKMRQVNTSSGHRLFLLEVDVDQLTAGGQRKK